MSVKKIQFHTTAASPRARTIGTVIISKCQHLSKFFSRDSKRVSNCLSLAAPTKIISTFLSLSVPAVKRSVIV